MGYCGENNPSVTASLCHLPLRTTPPSARWCEGYTGEASVAVSLAPLYKGSWRRSA